MALPVAAILLAAGSSKRMGRPKQLLPLGDKTAIHYCCDNLIAAGISTIIVVISPRGNEIADALRGLPVTLVVNQDPESEMAESIRIGVRALRHDAGVLICLSDHPLVSVETLRTLVQLHREDPRKIIYPAYNGKKGHPTLFPKSAAEEIFSSDTLRDIIKRDPERNRRVDVYDEGVVLDMDTEEDYQNILKKIAGR